MPRRSFDEEHFKRLIRQHAEQQDLSQAQFAERAEVAQTAVSGWLNARRNTGKTSIPKLNTAVGIADALGVSLDYLATGREYWPELANDTLKRLIRKMSKLDEFNLATVEFLAERLSLEGGSRDVLAAAEPSPDYGERDAGTSSRG